MINYRLLVFLATAKDGDVTAGFIYR